MSNQNPIQRELTAKERRDIKRLVTTMCANYDSEYACLPLDYGRCYMLDKWWTGAYCKYFREAVLPLNPALEASLLGGDIALHGKSCPVCGSLYLPKTSQTYCSDACRLAGRRKTYRDNKRKHKKT